MYNVVYLKNKLRLFYYYGPISSFHLFICHLSWACSFITLVNLSYAPGIMFHDVITFWGKFFRLWRYLHFCSKKDSFDMVLSDGGFPPKNFWRICVAHVRSRKQLQAKNSLAYESNTSPI